eukprot:3114956-Pleurochrysis_carterae.AAC.1
MCADRVCCVRCARATADVRAKISLFLQDIGLPLDWRTKEEGRIDAEKFYEEGHWQRFCCRGGKSPGGACLIATLVKMVADHYDEVAAAAARQTGLKLPQLMSLPLRRRRLQSSQEEEER